MIGSGSAGVDTASLPLTRLSEEVRELVVSVDTSSLSVGKSVEWKSLPDAEWRSLSYEAIVPWRKI